jgi:hypothetical protein
MKAVYRILGGLWMAFCCYYFAALAEGIYEVRPDRLDTLAINVFFVLLFLAGVFASFYLVIGARWARIGVSILALLTVAASVMGLFAFFNATPFSVRGIAFDLFALATAGVLLFAHKQGVA